MWSRLTSQAYGSGRLLLLLAGLSLLSMPVDYRGGAELPHAHALFQFWMSGDADAFDHHGPGAAHDDEHHDHHETSEANESSNFLGKRKASPDTPTVSDMGSPAETGSVMALGLLMAVILFTEGRRLLIATWSRALVGIRPLPELPPPRSPFAAL